MSFSHREDYRHLLSLVLEHDGIEIDGEFCSLDTVESKGRPVLRVKWRSLDGRSVIYLVFGPSTITSRRVLRRALPGLSLHGTSLLCRACSSAKARLTRCVLRCRQLRIGSTVMSSAVPATEPSQTSGSHSSEATSRSGPSPTLTMLEPTSEIGLHDLSQGLVSSLSQEEMMSALSSYNIQGRTWLSSYNPHQSLYHPVYNPLGYREGNQPLDPH